MVHRRRTEKKVSAGDGVCDASIAGRMVSLWLQVPSTWNVDQRRC